jgi:hypothetical protein
MRNLMGGVNALTPLATIIFNRKLDSIQQVLYSMIDSAILNLKTLQNSKKNAQGM